MEGDLQTARLEVADGAVFVGNCKVSPQSNAIVALLSRRIRPQGCDYTCVQTFCTERDAQFLQLCADIALGLVLFVGKFRMLVDGAADIPHPFYQFPVCLKQ